MSRRRSRPWRLAAVVAGGVLAGAVLVPVSAVAQAPRAQSTSVPPARVAVVPDTVTVGDVFRAAVRVDVPPGAQVGFPDSLVVEEPLESAGPREVLADTAAGSRVVTVAYPLTAWRPGRHALPAIPYRVVSAGTDTTLSAEVGAVEVVSVLPADTAGVEAKPPRGVIGGEGFRWWWLVAALALLALLLLAWWWWRRRRLTRPASAPALVPATARERAVAALDRVRGEGLLEAGREKEFYVATSHVLREYVAAVVPGASADLTTRELGGPLRRSVDEAARDQLVRLLQAMDFVKYARRRPGRERALEEWSEAVAWIQSWPPAPPPRDEAAGAAAGAGEDAGEAA